MSNVRFCLESIENIANQELKSPDQKIFSWKAGCSDKLQGVRKNLEKAINVPPLLATQELVLGAAQ